MSDVEKRVRDFYDNFGWVAKEGESGEDALFRHFSRPYYPYHEGVNARTKMCFSDLSGKLLMAGGGDLPEIHVAIARGFSATTFLDISSRSLEIAKQKFLDKGEYINESILSIPKPENHFDAVYCAHVIYHIDKDLQEKAVRELIRVTKPGGRIVLIYRNPASVATRLLQVKRKIAQLLRLKRRAKTDARRPSQLPQLYFFVHPLGWWTRFNDECDVDMIAWDVMSNLEEKQVFITDILASFGYRLCSWFENKCPKSAVRLWSYPIVILTKR